jgi:hypothetical protein
MQTVGWLAEQFTQRAKEDPAEHTEKDAAEIVQLKTSVENMLNLLVNLLKPGSVNGAVIEEGRDLLASLGRDVRV